jgi:hypothetical protein
MAIPSSRTILVPQSSLQSEPSANWIRRPAKSPEPQASLSQDLIVVLCLVTVSVVVLYLILSQ